MKLFLSGKSSKPSSAPAPAEFLPAVEPKPATVNKYAFSLSLSLIAGFLTESVW